MLVHCTTPHAGLLPSLAVAQPGGGQLAGARPHSQPARMAWGTPAQRLGEEKWQKIGGRASPWGWQGLDVGCGVPTVGVGGLGLGIAMRASEL